MCETRGMNEHTEPAGDQEAPPSAVPIGAAIYSRDGTEIGTVKDVREERFLVAVPQAFDYWLSTRGVAGVREGQVILSVGIGAVAEYLVDEDGKDLG